MTPPPKVGPTPGKLEQASRETRGQSIRHNSGGLHSGEVDLKVNAVNLEPLS